MYGLTDNYCKTINCNRLSTIDNYANLYSRVDNKRFLFLNRLIQKLSTFRKYLRLIK